jgi:hypothetical protein
MKEETVRAVFINYIKSLGKNPKIRNRHASGPDIIIEGAAYECKGSKFDKATLFKQVVSNAFQFLRVGIVIPYDALVREDPNLGRSIEIYVITEENGTYFLHRWSSAKSLLLEIDRVVYEHLPQIVKLTPEEKEPTILEFLKGFDDKMREYLRSIVIKKVKTLQIAGRVSAAPYGET